MMAPDPGGAIGPEVVAVRWRLERDPLCEARGADRRHCTRLAVTAVAEPGTPGISAGQLSSRCPGHAPADAFRLCVRCRRVNSGPDGYRCPACKAGADGYSDDRERWMR
jgi:hypothetical protein